ncbi:MAG: ribonuclease III [Deltaproteobacteria bacterium]|nr:ribonuclease III [Deltaproteobacteria bacterium]
MTDDVLRRLGPLEERLGYVFRDPALLEQALTHRSHVNEGTGTRDAHNERLEFLGDAVVDLVVGQFLMEHLPTAREGQLSKLRAMVVSEASLARAAEALAVGDYLRLGRGEEQTGGRRKTSILADAFEAVVGAVHLDGGFEVAARVVRALLGHLIERAVGGELDGDHKTRLQEVAQGQVQQVPRYEVLEERGPDHAKVFTVGVFVGDQMVARAEGHSKKEAEQGAARLALEAILNGS